MPFYHRLGKIPHKRHTTFKKPDGGYYETFLDVDGSESFPKYGFLDACKALGITKHVNKSDGKTTI